jgi:hypothetical protein
MLNGISNGIASFSGTGIRLLIRFIYNFGPAGPGARDVPASLIASHIDQLAPILRQHRDLVFALQGGFIGTWGEWHSSTSGNDNTASRKLVLDRLAQHFRGVFPILIRNPSHLMIWLGSSTPSPDFGIHNDYYASDPVDATYYPRDGFTEAEQRAFTQQTAATALFVAEFGALDQQRQACGTLDAYSYLYRPQSLSLYIYPGSVASYLQSQGCLLGFLNKVGTRIEARRVDATGSAAPGGTLRIALTLANAGYGRVIRARPATLVLHAGGQVVQQTPLSLAQLDLRTLGPAAQPTPRTFSFDLTLPSSLPSGTLTVSLLVPDPAPSLRPLAAYALPLNSLNTAGQEIFDPATGRNRLLTISSGVIAAR